MKKFQNRYRISSHRKPNWDYSAEGMYFLTIVTQQRECNLGEIILSTMILSDFGKIVESEWYKSFDIRDELFLDEFIIMPNHIHAIVILNNQNKIDHFGDGSVGGGLMGDGSRVETHGRASLQPTISTKPAISTQSIPLSTQSTPTSIQSPTLLNSNNLISTIKRNPAIRLPKSISSFMAGFKSAVNTKIDDYIDENKLQIPKYNRNNHFFQPNYNDHIVRNDWEYQCIKSYIVNNPQNWDTDKFNK